MSQLCDFLRGVTSRSCKKISQSFSKRFFHHSEQILGKILEVLDWNFAWNVILRRFFRRVDPSSNDGGPEKISQSFPKRFFRDSEKFCEGVRSRICRGLTKNRSESFSKILFCHFSHLEEKFCQFWIEIFQGTWIFYSFLKEAEPRSHEGPQKHFSELLNTIFSSFRTSFG